jgi:WhiB family redox-sensing transcriptional regulator
VDDDTLYAALVNGVTFRTLKELLNRPRWMSDGACREHTDLTWFPTRGVYAGMQTAKAVCSGCPVLETCLEWALERPMETREGIWAGTVRAERERLRRERREAA